jgi:hypothetical protein
MKSIKHSIVKTKVFCLLSFSVAVLCLFSCKKEQPALSKMDCSCAKEVSAEFKIEEIANYGFNWEKRTETDSILYNKNVSFKAITEDAEYVWYIGTEKINTQEVVRYFDQSLIGQKIPITLVVKKKANTICFPNDEGYDSITKTLTVTPYTIVTPDDYDLGSIEGTFRVKSNLLLDSFDIKISFVRDDEINPLKPLINFENYDGLGSICLNHQGSAQRNYRQVYFENFGGCKLMFGDIHNRLDGVFEMNVTFYYETHPEYAVHKYLGRRL